jgi:hypothetical protein
MHDDHSHDHGHDHHHGHGHQHHHHHPHGLGHNAARRAAQWQTPHDTAASQASGPVPEADFDLVEAAFVSGFANAPDPTSFLRLARIPFIGKNAEGEVLQLLRVETDEAVDIASLTPHIGGASMRYDPLPAKLVSRRRRLAFIYFDGKAARRLSFAEALALAPEPAR